MTTFQRVWLSPLHRMLHISTKREERVVRYLQHMPRRLFSKFFCSFFYRWIPTPWWWIVSVLKVKGWTIRLLATRYGQLIASAVPAACVFMSVLSSAFLAALLQMDTALLFLDEFTIIDLWDGKIPNGPFPYSCQIDFIKKKKKIVQANILHGNLLPWNITSFL